MLETYFYKDAQQITHVLGSGHMTQGLDKVHSCCAHATFRADKAGDRERLSIMQSKSNAVYCSIAVCCLCMMYNSCERQK